MAKRKRKKAEEQPIKQEFDHLLDDLLAIFPFQELQGLIKKMKDPMRSRDAGELLDIIAANKAMLEKEKTRVIKTSHGDDEQVKSYVENPSNFSKIQWEAIERTRQKLQKFERQVDYALEMEEIAPIDMEEYQKKKAQKKKKKNKRGKGRDKWLQM